MLYKGKRTLYKRYARWMRELRRIAQRQVKRSRYTWAAYCAGMTPTQFAADMLGL